MIRVLLVGAGGYAKGYIQELLGSTDPDLRWEGIVEPYFERCVQKEEIATRGIPVYGTMEEFYAAHGAELAIICTPTYLHREHSICALAHGSYVLCEKPAAPTVAAVEEMMAAEARYGKWIAIGYQWSYSEAMRALKQDVLAGCYGKPIALKTAISWPRHLAYYSRGTGWAGKIERDGVMILDSIASNACAHYLHNMLFLLGEDMESSATVTVEEGCCLRANAIENFDTCSIRMRAGDASLYFVASHAVDKMRNPEFIYRFEEADLTYSQDEGSQVTAIRHDGTVKVYGDPFASSFRKLWECVEAVRQGTKPVCTAKTALPHVRVIESLYRNFPVRDFPAETVRFEEAKNRIVVDGLFDKIYRAYEHETSLCELIFEKS